MSLMWMPAQTTIPPGATARSAAGTQALDPPDRLVPRHQRQLGRRQLAVDDVQVGAADAASRDPDQHLARARQRNAALLQRQGLPDTVEHHRAHLTVLTI